MWIFFFNQEMEVHSAVYHNNIAFRLTLSAKRLASHWKQKKKEKKAHLTPTNLLWLIFLCVITKTHDLWAAEVALMSRVRLIANQIGLLMYTQLIPHPWGLYQRKCCYCELGIWSGRCLSSNLFGLCTEAFFSQMLSDVYVSAPVRKDRSKLLPQEAAKRQFHHRVLTVWGHLKRLKHEFKKCQ